MNFSAWILPWTLNGYFNPGLRYWTQDMGAFFEIEALVSKSFKTKNIAGTEKLTDHL